VVFATPETYNALSFRLFSANIQSMSAPLYDAHNHLQDDRFGVAQVTLMAVSTQSGVTRMVVNGSCEQDWPQVLALARQFPQVLPSFGYHPWYVGERTPDWQKNLVHFLDEIPSAVGEIGLDRWKPDLPYEGQEEMFVAQLRLASERNLPVSIHCLQAWGRMLELLKTGPRPQRGFLLHSYGGPQEMVNSFADLGGYFSLPGYFAHDRKERQRETFKHVPADRILIETDAPDQSLPDALNEFPLKDANTSKPLNHPANLTAVYRFAANLFGETVDSLAARVEQNFLRLFGGL
jgi:TatD DNase family protein